MEIKEVVCEQTQEEHDESLKHKEPHTNPKRPQDVDEL